MIISILLCCKVIVEPSLYLLFVNLYWHELVIYFISSPHDVFEINLNISSVQIFIVVLTLIFEYLALTRRYHKCLASAFRVIEDFQHTSIFWVIFVIH